MVTLNEVPANSAYSGLIVHPFRSSLASRVPMLVLQLQVQRCGFWPGAIVCQHLPLSYANSTAANKSLTLITHMAISKPNRYSRTIWSSLESSHVADPAVRFGRTSQCWCRVPLANFRATIEVSSRTMHHLKSADPQLLMRTRKTCLDD